MGGEALVSALSPEANLLLPPARFLTVVRIGGPSAASLRRLSCAQFQRAKFLGDERGASKGIVFGMSEQVPRENRELARDGDSRDLRTTASTDSLVARTERAWRFHGGPGCFHEGAPRVRPPLFGNRTIRCRPCPGLPNPGIQAKIAHELGRGREAAYISNGGHKREGNRGIHSWNREQSADIGVVQCPRG